MESLIPSWHPRDSEKRQSASPLRSKVSSARALASDQIPTPEKRIQLRRMASRQRLSSINDVRRIAMGLRRARSEASNSPDLLRFDGELDQKAGPCPDSDAMSSSTRNIVKLPDKHEILVEFFNCMDSSIRLLRLKGVSSTFANIRASVQHLTERKFTYKHLAQLKYILSESISIKRVLLRDETTCCMKPELLISLKVDTVESKFKLRGESAYSVLRKLFRARLVQFVKEHSEEDEVPEEALPHPFGRRKPSMPIDSNESIPFNLAGTSSAVHLAEKLTTFSHFSGSFRRHFSQRTTSSVEVKSSLSCLNCVASKADSVSPLLSPVKFSSNLSIHNKSPFLFTSKRQLRMDHSIIVEDTKTLNSAHCSPSRGVISSASTPVKEISTPARLMTTTPELHTPKRIGNSTVEDALKKKLVKRATRTRLFPSPRKNVGSDGAENMSGNSTLEDDVSFLPESLLQDIKEKERKMVVEREMNAASARLRKKMIANLPKLLNSILFIFQSGSRCVITRQELVHKILSTHCSVVDRNEVEEQLRLMQELIPDWISQKVSITGDVLYRLNKTSSVQEIRQLLATVK